MARYPKIPALPATFGRFSALSGQSSGAVSAIARSCLHGRGLIAGSLGNVAETHQNVHPSHASDYGAQSPRIQCTMLPAAVHPCQQQNRGFRADRSNLVRMIGLCMAIAFLDVVAAHIGQARAYQLSCQGMTAYEMGKCLRARRESQEESEEGGRPGEGVEESKMRLRQYEQPGELVTLPSGIQFREILEGSGAEATFGRKLSIRYTVFKLSAGAYFKYSSGGTPVLLFALGYGTEGKNDVGETYDFVLGDERALPAAATLGMVGMRVGGRRRILIPPQFGWLKDLPIGPPPDTFGARRRLANNRDAPLLFEAELVRVSSPGDVPVKDFSQFERVQLGSPYSLPTPPRYGESGPGN